jgi:hypothetical protein
VAQAGPAHGEWYPHRFRVQDALVIPHVSPWLMLVNSLRLSAMLKRKDPADSFESWPNSTRTFRSPAVGRNRIARFQWPFSAERSLHSDTFPRTHVRRTRQCTCTASLAFEGCVPCPLFRFCNKIANVYISHSSLLISRLAYSGA